MSCAMIEKGKQVVWVVTVVERPRLDDGHQSAHISWRERLVILVQEPSLTDVLPGDTAHNKHETQT